MSKTNAYFFKFVAPEWLAASSKVQMLNYEEKGLFIELCAILICEKGRIKHDDLLHRKLRIGKPELSRSLEQFMKLELVVSDGEYLSVKFISEALGEMHEERKKRIENGRKGGRPKTKQNLSSNEQNQNQKDNKSFESPRPPEGGSPEPSKFIPNEKKETLDPDHRRDSFMKQAWLDSGKPLDEYERRTATLPELSIDDMNCIMSFDPDPDKKFYFDLKRAKALLGQASFSEELHMLKCRVQEGAAQNPRAYFNTLIKKAIHDKNLT